MTLIEWVSNSNCSSILILTRYLALSKRHKLTRPFSMEETNVQQSVILFMDDKNNTLKCEAKVSYCLRFLWAVRMSKNAIYLLAFEPFISVADIW